MNHPSQHLQARRQALIAQAAAQRAELAHCMTALRKPLAIADSGFRIVRFVRKHPLLMLGASTIIGLIRPAHLSKWLKASLSALQLLRHAKSWFTQK